MQILIQKNIVLIDDKSFIRLVEKKGIQGAELYIKERTDFKLIQDCYGEKAFNSLKQQVDLIETLLKVKNDYGWTNAKEIERLQNFLNVRYFGTMDFKFMKEIPEDIGLAHLQAIVKSFNMEEKYEEYKNATSENR